MSNSSMKMVEKNLANITEDEAALYDRQIRLWGLDAQKRLRASRVLVAGVCGMGAEVTKNLVLSGIKSLTLLDHRNLTEIDVCANFLAPHDAVGQNIAEVSKERAQILNPMVEVSSDSDDIEKKTDEFFKQFDVVCAMRCSKEQLLRISNICHQNKILFFGGDVFGMIGYMFADLQEHQYVEEVKEKVEVEQDGKKQTVEETKMVKRTENFVPLSQALDVDWTTTKYASQLRRTSSTYFIMHIIMEFITLHGRNPNPAHRAEDEVELLTIKNALLEKMGIPQEKVDNQFARSCLGELGPNALEVKYLCNMQLSLLLICVLPIVLHLFGCLWRTVHENMVYGQLSPVCAIVGGVLAQEIIKAVSQKDPPHNNFFFFNTQDGAGVVECIGH